MRRDENQQRKERMDANCITVFFGFISEFGAISLSNSVLNELDELTSCSHSDTSSTPDGGNIHSQRGPILPIHRGGESLYKVNMQVLCKYYAR